MSLFPPSTNVQYRGHPVAAWYLLLSGFLELVPGCIHYFIPEYAAHHIAGLDLSHNASLIFGTFAWMGSVQIPFGLAIIIVALRYRAFVPLFLLLNLLERLFMSLAAWVLHPAADGHHPPENYASPVSVGLLAIFLILSLQNRKEA